MASSRSASAQSGQEHAETRPRQTARKTQTPGFGATRSADEWPETESSSKESVDEASSYRSGDSEPKIIHIMPNARNHAIKEAAIRARLPELVPATGPPLAVEESFTAVSAVPAGQDPRLTAVSMGFPISVHPLRLPNSRGTLSTGSTTSLIDTRCVRLAGLLARMVPIRPIDEVHISTLFGGQHMNVFGRVDVTFDAFGFEFSTPCWVVNLGLPVDIALGMDWLETYNPKISWRQELEITDANAKKVRKLVDIYVTE